MGIDVATALNAGMNSYQQVDNKRLQEQQIASQQSRVSADDQRAAERHEWSRQEHKRQSRLLADEEIQKEGTRAWAQYKASGYQYFDPEFSKKAAERGATEWLPEYWANPGKLQANLTASKMLQGAMQSKDLTSLNSPEFMEQLNTVFDERINKGVGEVHAESGMKIVDKKIVGFDFAPTTKKADGSESSRLVPRLQITLEDGSTYDAPSTVGATSNEYDPVLTEDFGDLVDDMIGRGQMAQAISQDPEFLKSVHIGEQALGIGGKQEGKFSEKYKDPLTGLYGQDDPNNKFIPIDVRKGGKTGADAGGKLPDKAQYIEYLKASYKKDGIDLTTAEAQAIANEAVHNPTKYIEGFIQDRLDTQNDTYFQGEPMPLEEIEKMAVESHRRIKQMLEPQQALDTPPPAEGETAVPDVKSVIAEYDGKVHPKVLEFLRSNPDTLPLFLERYGQPQVQQ